MPRLALLALVPLLSAPALAAPAESLPVVRQELDDVRAFCRERGKDPLVAPGFATLVDLDEDGRPDLVLDDEKARCREGIQPRCGSGGCTVRVFLAAGDGFKPVLRKVGASHRVERTPDGMRLTVVQKRFAPVVFRFAEGCAIPTTDQGKRSCED